MYRNRDELIHLLSEAAETEHSLCCMYLFAAVSLKQDVTEGLNWKQLRSVQDWADTFYLLARQEMEHLGLVSNLLTAIGAAPHFWRPNFPQRSAYFPAPFTLEPLSEAAIMRFICFERPVNVILPPEFHCTVSHARSDIVPHGEEYIPEPISSIEQLYERIRWLIEHLPLPDEKLFIGPPKAQVDGSVLHVNFPRDGALGGIFDTTLFPIRDRTSSVKAIDLIIEQGEGAPGDQEFSHFARLQRLLTDYRTLRQEDPLFEPARPLVSNPILYEDDAAPGGTLITDRAAQAVLDLLNGAYETLLLFLARVYAPSGESANEMTALFYTFFPMMTHIVRPLSEILVTLPALATNPELRAGPSYELSRQIDLLPDKQSTWRILDERLHNLAEEAETVSKHEQLGPPQRERLAYIAQNLRIMTAKFSRVAQGTYPQQLLTPGLFAHLPPTGP